MSSLVVQVSQVAEIKSHENANALEIAEINGWQVVVRKGEWHAGDLGVYFPPDALLPIARTDEFGVTQYCQTKKSENDPQFVNELGQPLARIRCARLRGEPSFGLFVPLPVSGTSWALGEDVAGHYGAQKYLPPVRTSAGDAEVEHPLFVQLAEIESLRNFLDVLEPGELVSVTEKLHGTSCRVGIIAEDGALTVMAGSRQLRRKSPADGNLVASTYWYPWTLSGVRSLLDTLATREHRQVILFGEVYGRGIQSFQYGQHGIAFAAFDLLVDGKYLDVDEFQALCREHEVPTVPELWRGPFSLAQAQALSKGRAFQGTHIREGVVVKPLRERHDPRVGRVVLKYPSDDYLLGLKEDFTDR